MDTGTQAGTVAEGKGCAKQADLIGKEKRAAASRKDTTGRDSEKCQRAAITKTEDGQGKHTRWIDQLAHPGDAN